MRHNSRAAPQDHLAATRDALPCEDCGGPGWVFGGEYGLVVCADCNDEGQRPRPMPILERVRFPLTKPPEPWVESNRRRGYECGQCGVLAVRSLYVLGWWACRCLAAAETAQGVVVLTFPQPVRAG